jgi:hypothetical protein
LSFSESTSYEAVLRANSEKLIDLSKVRKRIRLYKNSYLAKTHPVAKKDQLNFIVKAYLLNELLVRAVYKQTWTLSSYPLEVNKSTNMLTKGNRRTKIKLVESPM